MVSECKLIFAQVLSAYSQGTDYSEPANNIKPFVLSEDLTWKMSYIDKILKAIVSRVAQGQIDIEQAKIDARELYITCGFNAFMDYKYLANLIDLRLNIIEIRYAESEDKVNILKNIFNENKTCPVVEIKNSINTMCFDALVDYVLMPYAADFAQEVIDAVSALSEEEKKVENVFPGMLRIKFGA